jgi:hypothetical protein
MLYLQFYGGYARVVGENDNWSVAHQMAGETGRLFAAAPDLLAALKAVCKAWDDREDDYFPGMTMAQDLAEEAIAKAEGRGK